MLLLVFKHDNERKGKYPHVDWSELSTQCTRQAKHCHDAFCFKLTELISSHTVNLSLQEVNSKLRHPYSRSPQSFITKLSTPT